MLRNIFLVTLLIYSVSADRVDIKKPDMTALVKLKKDMLCTGCTTVMKWVKDHLPPKPTLDILKQLFYMACDEIPFVSSICKNYVDEYIDEVYQIIQTDDPQTICKKIYLC